MASSPPRPADLAWTNPNLTQSLTGAFCRKTRPGPCFIRATEASSEGAGCARWEGPPTLDGGWCTRFLRAAVPWARRLLLGGPSPRFGGRDVRPMLFLHPSQTQRARDRKGHPRTREQGSDLRLWDPAAPLSCPIGPSPPGLSRFLLPGQTPHTDSQVRRQLLFSKADTRHGLGWAPCLSHPISQPGPPSSSL